MNILYDELKRKLPSERYYQLWPSLIASNKKRTIFLFSYDDKTKQILISDANQQNHQYIKVRDFVKQKFKIEQFISFNFSISDDTDDLPF